MELDKCSNSRHNNRFGQTQAKRYQQTTIRTQVSLNQSIENQILEFLWEILLFAIFFGNGNVKTRENTYSNHLCIDIRQSGTLEKVDELMKTETGIEHNFSPVKSDVKCFFSYCQYFFCQWIREVLCIVAALRKTQTKLWTIYAVCQRTESWVSTERPKFVDGSIQSWAKLAAC